MSPTRLAVALCIVSSAACSREHPAPKQADVQPSQVDTGAPQVPAPTTWTPDLPTDWLIAAIDTLWHEPQRQLKRGTTFRFANGRSWETTIVDAQLLGALARDNGSPFFVVSGWECDACDAKPHVWIRSPDDGPLTSEARLQYFPFPGQISAMTDDTSSAGEFEVIFRSRLFIGECQAPPSRGVLWLTEALRDGRWLRRALLAAVADNKLHVDTLTDSLALPASIEARVSALSCREVPGVRQIAM